MFLLEVTFSQMAIHSDLYLGSDYELYNAFEKTSFHTGVVTIDRNGGLFSFAANASWENSDNTRYLDGSIRKYGPSTFTFPSGHSGRYQPIHISQAENNAFLDVTFVANPHRTQALSLDLEGIHPDFYWSVENASEQGRLTLTWNTHSNIDVFTNSKPLNSLTIAGLQAGRWQVISSLVDINSLIDSSTSSLLSGSITSENTLNLGTYSAFTIGLKSKSSISAEQLTIMEALTPNNDGINDQWIIEEIEIYPLAQVMVYNRLGKQVFSALNGYDNSWTGNFNGSLDPLPVGPYFYTIDLDADGKIDLQGWIYINY
jgi:gliding motility-associated-like protein